MDENYEPFGDEWKAEMKKWNKTLLIDFLAKNLASQRALKDAVNRYVESPSMGAMVEMSELAK